MYLRHGDFEYGAFIAIELDEKRPIDAFQNEKRYLEKSIGIKIFSVLHASFKPFSVHPSDTHLKYILIVTDYQLQEQLIRIVSLDIES